jgi:hypothetical protein
MTTKGAEHGRLDTVLAGIKGKIQLKLRWIKSNIASVIGRYVYSSKF